MQIRKLQLLSGAQQARGLAVVIDVFRATSNIVTLLARDAREITPVATLEEAYALKAAHPDWLLAGERHGLPPEGFDLGNSPFEAEQSACQGKTVVLTTSAGSRGLVAAAEHADEVIAACFLNARAVADYISARKPETVSLVALGVCAETPSPEDDGAADYIARLLYGENPDPEEYFSVIRAHPEGRKFLDPNNLNYRAEDIHACLRVNVYDLVPVMRGEVLVRG